MVYRIDFNDCEATYVGLTGRRLVIRIREHKKRCEKYDNNNALYTHMSNSAVLLIFVLLFDISIYTHYTEFCTGYSS